MLGVNLLSSYFSCFGKEGQGNEEIQLPQRILGFLSLVFDHSPQPFEQRTSTEGAIPLHLSTTPSFGWVFFFGPCRIPVEAPTGVDAILLFRFRVCCRFWINVEESFSQPQVPSSFAPSQQKKEKNSKSCKTQQVLQNPASPTKTIHPIQICVKRF